MTLLALPIVSDVMLAGLERNLPLRPPPDAMPRAIVILGGDLDRTADPPFVLPGLSEFGPHARRRGVVSQDRAADPGHRRHCASRVARRWRRSWRKACATISGAGTWVEDASDDTWENAAFSAEILKKQGIHSVYVVTQGWHMRRAMLAFRHAGLIATAAPTSLESPIDPIAWDFLPRASAWGMELLRAA